MLMKCICPTRDAELDYADRFMNFLNRFNENWHTLGSDSLNSIPNWIHSIHDVKGRFRAHGAQISAVMGSWGIDDGSGCLVLTYCSCCDHNV